MTEPRQLSPQDDGAAHAALAEQMAADVPERDVPSRPLNSVAVIGGGTMGAGITTALLQSGFSAVMVERDEASLERGRSAVLAMLDAGVSRGKMEAAERDRIVADRFAGSTEYGAVSRAALVIEAVFEDMAVKRAVFAELDRHARPGAVLATNTSYLDVNEIAAATSRPADVIGLHFFSPAHIMRLMEVVVPDKADDDAVATGFALARRMRKVAVRAGVCDGFIGNRILAHCRKVVDYMMLDGASPYEIDAAIEGFGFAMGPFAVSDLAGLDIGWAARKRLAPTRDARERYVAIADRICEKGWFGRKTGQGYYLHVDGAKPQPNPAVMEIVEQQRREARAAIRNWSAEEIVVRYLTAMANEGTRIVEEGIALRPIDVDAVELFGYGFPKPEGGPLFWADRRGLGVVLKDTESFAREDPFFWRQPELMKRLADRGAGLAELNRPAAAQV